MLDGAENFFKQFKKIIQIGASTLKPCVPLNYSRDDVQVADDSSPTSNVANRAAAAASPPALPAPAPQHPSDEIDRD